MRRRRTAVAYHEAGHAVAYLALRKRFRHVTIKPTATGIIRDQGRRIPEGIQNDRWPRWRQVGWFHDELFIAMAGPVAEARYMGRRNRVGVSSDEEHIADLALRLFEDERARVFYLRHVDAGVWAFVRSETDWSQVARVADALLLHETLRWVQAAALFYARPDLQAFRP